MLFPQSNERVKDSAELRRVLALPRRSAEPWDEQALVEELTRQLKTPEGTMTLRSVQAVALTELVLTGGLFGPIRVGGGKTLLSFLSPAVLDAERPVLLVPADLREKTKRDFEELRKHWVEPHPLTVVSYETISHKNNASILFDLKPDFIVADEAHALRNVVGAACASRVFRYFEAYPDTMFVGMSGTMTKQSLLDFWHMLFWALPPDERPLTQDYEELLLWARALDLIRPYEKAFPAQIGALKLFCPETPSPTRREARQGFQRRLTDTPGVVATQETEVDASINIRCVFPDVSSPIEKSFEQLRQLWELPSDDPLDDPMAVGRAAKQLGLGFYYRFEPPPPLPWKQARSTWAAFVRQKLRVHPGLDTEAQIRERYIDHPLCQDWLAVRDDYDPEENRVAEWVDEKTIVNFCIQWAHKKRGLIWVAHRAFGERLQDISGFSYFASQGRDQWGVPVEEHPPGKPAILSVESNKKGRNLQAWNQNLLTAFPSDGTTIEQLIGRTHRPGQEKDAVYFDVITTCVEHIKSIHKAKEACTYQQDLLGSPQKILQATIDMPTWGEVSRRSGFRWAA